MAATVMDTVTPTRMGMDIPTTATHTIIRIGWYTLRRGIGTTGTGITDTTLFIINAINQGVSL